ncbi:MAG: ribonuclease D [Planctomycetaceae bacterium]|nr:ribonuclease D [Planctomycetaceae bacterium]
MRSLEGVGALALDTESDSFFHYFEKVCLLQIADDRGRAALVDPLAFRDLSALAPIMADPKVEKILHGADNDIMLLKRDFKFEFASLFDTQVAARFAGRLELGLQAVLETEFGVKLSKSLQRCDWSRRPFSEAQAVYAAEDVRHLIALRDRLIPELRKRGREAWAREEGEALARLAPAPLREPSDFLKAKGAWDLDGRTLAVLRELFALRDEWARNADIPLFKIVGDEPLVALAVQKPKDQRALSQVRGLSGALKGRYAQDLLQAIRRGEAVPDDKLPTRTWSARPKPVIGYSKRVDRIKAWRVEAAKKAGLEPGVLLPQRLIERIAIDRPTDLAALAAVPEIRRWRAENFGEEILAAARQ